MSKTKDMALDGGFFTEEDLESFKTCSKIVFKNVRFKEENIITVVGKQDLKKVLSYLFRAGNCAEKNVNSRDNWYSYIEGGKQVRLACLFDDMERENAVLKTMQYIKRETGFRVPHVLLRFDLYFDAENYAPTHSDYEDGRPVNFGFRAPNLSEKYMHYLGMLATSGVDHVMQELKMPKYKGQVVNALITDTPTEYWSYYILISSDLFDLSDWVAPKEYC